MEFYIKPGFKLNPNPKIVEGIVKGIKRCDGECPCHNTGATREARMCPCENYRLHDNCCCTLYVKDEENKEVKS